MPPSMLIETTIHAGIACVKLNRADKKNAMLLEMRDGLAQIFESLNDRDDVRAVVLTGAGTDFCAGADVSEMGKGGLNGSLFRARHMQRLMRSIARLQKPAICAVRGVSVGMGFSMALACDVVIASDTARFAQIQRRIALPPDAGAVWFLTRYLGLAKAKELVFSGRMVAATEALELGLVARVVADADLDARAMALAHDYAEGPTHAFAFAKRMFDVAPSITLDAFLDHEASMVPLSVTAEDFKEGTRAFLEKRKPVFTGN